MLLKLTFLLAMVLALPPLHADTFNYLFSDAVPGSPPILASFTYSSPTLITTDTTTDPTTCSVQGAACTSLRIDPVNGILDIRSDGSVSTFYLQGLPASDFTVGDHPVGFGSLEIEELPGEAPVSEPPSLLLLGCGLLGCGIVLRPRA